MRLSRIVTVAVALAIALLIAAIAALVALGIPRNAAGMAARSVCSAAFVAGRAPERVFDDDVRPASAVLSLVTVEVDREQRRTVGRFAGIFERHARHLGERGCVLDAPTNANVVVPTPPRPDATPSAQRAAWPDGNAPLEPARWGGGIDATRLQALVDAAFTGAGDPQGANARAVAVVHRGRLLVNRAAPGFDLDTRLHGWSMSKTVVAMLAHKLAAEAALDTQARVVDVVAGKREPAWAATWRSDARASIRVDDLLWMRDGLANEENYAPWGAVPRMLFGSADVAGHAASAQAEAPPATRWRYSSGTTNILAQAMRSRFEDDAAYWAYPRRALFAPIGAHGAVLETDAAGTWIASSYLWASSGDWARLGQLLLEDGRWQGREVMPPGFLARASSPATASGDGRAYGAQAWRIGEPDTGTCKGAVPADTIAMRGHWGQIVAVVPSRQAVVVRLGWTFDRDRFDGCRFVADVLSALGGLRR